MTNFKCPDCNAKIIQNQKKCKKCWVELIRKTLNNTEGNKENKSSNLWLLIVFFFYLFMISHTYMNPDDGSLIIITTAISILYCIIAIAYKKLNKWLTNEKKYLMSRDVRIALVTIWLMLLLTLILSLTSY